MKPVADIHCHPTMHPYAWNKVQKNKNNSVWNYDKPKKHQRNDAFPEFSQADYKSMIKGGVKLAFVSLYPIEQGWFQVKGNEGPIVDLASRMISKLPTKFINLVQRSDHNYFMALEDEYQFLKNESGCNPSVKVNGVNQKGGFNIAKNSADIDSIIDDQNKIATIITIEGGHSLLSGNAETVSCKLSETDKINILNNIKTIKKWEHPPFFITLAHHFYNGIVGHARSFTDIPSYLLNQKEGMGGGISDFGNTVIDTLLDLGKNSDGHRILIDVKHMTWTARQQYYQKIETHNKSADDTIPIIVSHAGYSGIEKIEDFKNNPDTSEKYKDSNIYNNWSINLAGDELVQIHKSEGLIGLNFDERILTGKARMKYYKSKEVTPSIFNKGIRNRETKIVKFWADQLALQIFEMVSIMINASKTDCLKIKAWDRIAIGSDFDGMINAIDAYITSEELKNLDIELSEAFSRNNVFLKISFGMTPEQLVRKIMFTNAYDFAKKFYR